MRGKILSLLLVFSLRCYTQDSIHPAITNPLRISLSKDGSSWFQITFLNQVWLRYNQSNDSTTLFGKPAPHTVDVGLRRTRIQMFGQLNERSFLYFQFGQNNFNSATNYTNNRKLAAFFHDALCEYRISRYNQLKIGGGLTIMNGLSRFSQPSIGTAPGLDVPVFLQYSVDQIDLFDRRLAVYARGQINRFDYRVYVANPFPVTSNGQPPPALSSQASFVNPTLYAQGRGPGISNQFGGYFMYNFLENEPHVTPYMTGTFLGTKKVMNVAIGTVYQKNALWHLQAASNRPVNDTVFSDMFHIGLEFFCDMPVGDRGAAINAVAGFYNTDYGKNYLRYNGLMNPATGSSATRMLQANAHGNAFPMFGTGQTAYVQFACMLPGGFGQQKTRIMPYANFHYSQLQALQYKHMMVAEGGVTWLLSGHQSKFSVGIQNRPTYYLGANNIKVEEGKRKTAVITQYQIMF